MPSKLQSRKSTTSVVFRYSLFSTRSFSPTDSIPSAKSQKYNSNHKRCPANPPTANSRPVTHSVAIDDLAVLYFIYDRFIRKRDIFEQGNVIVRIERSFVDDSFS